MGIITTTITRKIPGQKKTLLGLALLTLSIYFILQVLKLELPYSLNNEDDEQIRVLEDSINKNNSRSGNYSGLADFYSILNIKDENEIESLYFKSVSLNPFAVEGWLGLSEHYLQNNDKRNAKTSLNRALDLSNNYPSRLWESSILAMRLGEEEIASENLKKVIISDPERRPRAFETSWILFKDSELITDKIITDESIVDYLQFLIRKRDVSESKKVFENIREINLEQNIDDRTFRDYINLLIAHKEIDHAYAEWRNKYPLETPDLVWNSGFENDILNYGFDWIINKGNNFEISIDDINNSKKLRIDFNGEDNLDFRNLYQIVPVEPGSEYDFIFNMETLDITTRNGLGWEIICFNTNELIDKTQFLIGTNSGKDYKKKISIPENCNSIKIILRRYKSNKLDKYINGTIWINKVTLDAINY